MCSSKSQFMTMLQAGGVRFANKSGEDPLDLLDPTTSRAMQRAAAGRSTEEVEPRFPDRRWPHGYQRRSCTKVKSPPCGFLKKMNTGHTRDLHYPLTIAGRIPSSQPQSCQYDVPQQRYFGGQVCRLACGHSLWLIPVECSSLLIHLLQISLYFVMQGPQTQTKEGWGYRHSRLRRL